MPKRVGGVFLRWSPPHHGKDSPHTPECTGLRPMPTSQAEVLHICAHNRQTDTDTHHVHVCVDIRTLHIVLFTCARAHIRQDGSSSSWCCITSLQSKCTTKITLLEHITCQLFWWYIPLSGHDYYLQTDVTLLQFTERHTRKGSKEAITLPQIRSIGHALILLRDV